MYQILDKIESPADLRQLSPEQLPELCREIRDYMVHCCAENPGHLGSSLGAVELIVALHYIYNTPEDKIVFDVGHQAYAHKILTGRREAFRTNRTRGGISGFPKMDESPFDAFGTGHSSTSISAALGLAEAAALSGSPEKAVAIIGDGAMSGGLAWEGLNNAGNSKADILIILNDNDISIDKATGSLHRYLLKLTTNPGYNRLKRKVWNVLGAGWLRDKIQQMVTGTKSIIVSSSGGDVFEALGFRYFGPVDGNDIETVIAILQRLKNLKGPRILHVHTTKGKGYAPAEAAPTVWHAPGKFDPETGERIPSGSGPARYQDVFGTTLCQIAEHDPRVVGITPAMASGCGMTAFSERFPDRFFDVGIAEEHAVTFSAGLAAGGMIPFCNIYSSFSQRAYDQIIHDAALQKLPVILCFDRAGLVGEDGATHAGSFDLAAYRSVPGITISAPRNEFELKCLMHSAITHKGGPYIIRYPRGGGEGVEWKDVPAEVIPEGKGEKLLEGSEIAILGIGPAVNRALEAAAHFKETSGTCPAVYDMRFLKPLDEAILEEVSGFKTVITVEDGALKGGLFGAVSEYFAPRAGAPVIKGAGIPDIFISQASRSEQLHACGIDAEGIFVLLSDLMKNI